MNISSDSSKINVELAKKAEESILRGNILEALLIYCEAGLLDKVIHIGKQIYGDISEDKILVNLSYIVKEKSVEEAKKLLNEAELIRDLNNIIIEVYVRSIRAVREELRPFYPFYLF